MNKASLHIVVDPLCGWTYAAAPLIELADAHEGLDVQIHCGGMITGERRRRITPEWREFVMGHDRRIAEVSHQPFGDNYFNGLLKNSGVLLDSEPPTTAILAAKTLGVSAAIMLNQSQKAWFLNGEDITQLSVLAKVACEAGVDESEFTIQFERLAGDKTQQFILNSRALLNRFGGQGFPSAALETSEGVEPLNISRYYGDPQGWRTTLNSRFDK